MLVIRKIQLDFFILSRRILNTISVKSLFQNPRYMYKFLIKMWFYDFLQLYKFKICSISHFFRYEPIYKEEEEQFLLWFSKTPLGRRKARALELEQEQQINKEVVNKKKWISLITDCMLYSLKCIQMDFYNYY